jgi:galactokinase
MFIKAPGRVNLIGEHTDYNGGFVMPIAIDRFVWLEADARNDNEVRMYSEVFDENCSFDLGDIHYDEKCRWANYIKGVVYFLLERGSAVSGADVRVGGDVPIGAGLSSSAALEVATCSLFRKMFDLEIADKEIPILCQKAENEFVGVNCGIMDQFVSMFGQEGKALFLDCRSLEYRQIPFETDGIALLVINTNVKRELASSEYNTRRKQCEEGVALLNNTGLKAESLRDVPADYFEEKRGILPPLVADRCEHVISENRRVLDATGALEDSDFEKLGRLFYESHDSLRDLYDVSCKELDVIVDIARGFDGVLGARMTGAGFGGCAIALVQEDRRNAFEKHVYKTYEKETGLTPEIYNVKPSAGAGTTFFASPAL